MLTVVAFREKTWLDPKFDYRQWDHLCRNYQVKLLMVDTIEEFNELELESPVIVFDELATKSYLDLPYFETGTYVFGKTHLNGFQNQITHEDVVRIFTPNREPCLFGAPAGAIALARRSML